MKQKIYFGYILISILLLTSVAQACEHDISFIVDSTSDTAVSLGETATLTIDADCAEGCTSFTYTFALASDWLNPLWSSSDDSSLTVTDNECTTSALDTAGSEAILYMADCSGGGSDGGYEVIDVVEVASLTPDVGTVIDDDDGDADTIMYSIEKESSGNIIVTAVSNPGITVEADLPSGWTLDGGTGGLKLSRTVSKATVGTTTITCTSGTSEKVLTIVVIDGFTVEPDPAYVKVGGEQVFKALMPDGSGGVGDVTSSTTFTTTSGSFDVTETNKLTAGATASSSVGDFNVNATYPGETPIDVPLTVFEVTLDKVEFTSDHGLMNANKTTWVDAGAAYTGAEWVSSPSCNNPISQTKNTSLKTKVSCTVKPTGLTFDLSGDGSEDRFDFSCTGESSNGASKESSEMTADEKLLDEVDTISGEDIAWKITFTAPEPDIEVSLGNSGSHKIYVTWDTPNTGASSGSVVTEKRIIYVCEKADGLGGTDVTEAADALFLSLTGTFVLNATEPSPIWTLHNSGVVAECPGLAKYVNVHFEMLGLGSGSLNYCLAKIDGTYSAETVRPASTPVRTVVPGSGHPDPTTHGDYYDEIFTHLDGSTPPGRNDFEATCFFNSYHYALGVSEAADPGAVPPTPEQNKFANAEEVVKAAFTSIVWQYVTVSGGTTVHYNECTDDPWTESED